MRLFRNIFDSRVAVAEANPRMLEVDESTLFPAERSAVQGAVAKRRREFVAGRMLARQAMVALGVPPQPVLVNGDRSPIWPEGVVGSITHTTTWCAVALARNHDISSLGLDVEAATPMAEELWQMICTDYELSWLHTMPRSQRGVAAKFLFSAKESMYKAQYPLTGEICDFDEIEIHVSGDWDQWTGMFLRSRRRDFRCGDTLRGRMVHHGGHIATAVVVSR